MLSVYSDFVWGLVLSHIYSPEALGTDSIFLPVVPLFLCQALDVLSPVPNLYCKKNLTEYNHNKK